MNKDGIDRISDCKIQGPPGSTRCYYSVKIGCTGSEYRLNIGNERTKYRPAENNCKL